VGGLVAAWAVGEGLIVYRAWRQSKAPPLPGQLVASSALFVMLALLAQADSARGLATALAWGFDLAAFLNLAPAVTTGAGNLKTSATSTPAAKQGATA
jgi:hypothetical protein